MVTFALVDVVPQIAARETHERPSQFSVVGQKGLFQHNRRLADENQRSSECPLLGDRKSLTCGQSDANDPLPDLEGRRRRRNQPSSQRETLFKIRPLSWRPHYECRLLARMRSPVGRRIGLLGGLDRTWSCSHSTNANDPTETSHVTHFPGTLR